MTTIFRSIFRLGNLCMVAGIVVSMQMKTLPKMTMTVILLGLVAVYLLWALFSANRPNTYSGPNECFADLMGDICAYTWTFGALVLWLLAPRMHWLDLRTQPHYNLTSWFLAAMTAVTLIELAVSVRTSLLTMFRIDSISVGRRY